MDHLKQNPKRLSKKLLNNEIKRGQKTKWITPKLGVKKSIQRLTVELQKTLREALESIDA